jgi:hypothetical protein
MSEPDSMNHCIFLGQPRVHDHSHDEAAPCIFYDPKADRCETVIQVYRS